MTKSEQPEGVSTLSIEEDTDVYREPPESTDCGAGIRSWLCVVASGLFLASSFGFIQCIGVIQSHLSLHQLSAYKSRDIGWITGVYTFLSLFCGVQAGPLIDSYGPRRLAPLAAAILIPMYFALAECKVYWHFMLCLGILGGIGAAFGSMVAITSIGKSFVKRRGLAMGIALSGASCGGVIFPLLLRWILEPLGWRWSFRIIGFMVTMFMGTGIICFFQSTTSNSSSVTTRKGSSKHTAMSFAAFRSGPFSFIAGGMFLFELAIFGISGLLPTFAAAAGTSASTGFILIAVLNSCSAVGRVLPGLAGDRFGHFDVFLLMALVTAILTGVIFVPFGSTSVGVLYGFAALWGFGSGSWLSIMPVCISKTCNPEEYGRFYGTMAFVASFAALISIPIGGQLLETVGSAASSGLYLIAVVLGSLCFLMSRSLLYGKTFVIRSKI